MNLMRKLTNSLLVVGLLCAIWAVPPVGANEATAQEVCIRISRSGELLRTTVYSKRIAMFAQNAVNAVHRAAPFPPLPDGSPEFMDFHFIVVNNCTGAIWNDKMQLCSKRHPIGCNLGEVAFPNRP